MDQKTVSVNHQAVHADRGIRIPSWIYLITRQQYACVLCYFYS